MLPLHWPVWHGFCTFLWRIIDAPVISTVHLSPRISQGVLRMSHDQTEGPGISLRGRRSRRVEVSQGFIYQRRPDKEDISHLFRKVIRPVIQQSSVLTNSRYYSAIYLTPDNYAKSGLPKSKKVKLLLYLQKLQFI